MVKISSRNFTPNFTIDHCEHSDTAKRLGIDNTLPSVYYDNAMAIAKYVLEPLVERFGSFSPTSWYRCNLLNKAVGSGDKSQHKTASAVDFIIPKKDNLEVALWIRDNLIFDQLILEGYNRNKKGWIHCSWVKGINRQQHMRMINGEYLKGLE